MSDLPPPSHHSGAPATWKLHLTLSVGLAICVGAFIFELSRALGGNGLSWAYVFEWPIFGAFGIYMWWHLLHDDDRPDLGGSPSPVALTDPGTLADQKDGAADPDLLAWETYVRTMESGEAHPPGS